LRPIPLKFQDAYENVAVNRQMAAADVLGAHYYSSIHDVTASSQLQQLQQCKAGRDVLRCVERAPAGPAVARWRSVRRTHARQGRTRIWRVSYVQPTRPTESSSSSSCGQLFVVFCASSNLLLRFSAGRCRRGRAV